MERANQKLNSLLDLWSAKRGKKAMPARADLPAALLKPWLGNLALIDVDGDEPCFRLCGTNLHKRFGGEVTRRKVSSLDREIVASLETCIATVVRDSKPKDHSFQMRVDGEVMSFREMCLPLSDNGAAVQTILLVSYPVMNKKAPA